MALINKLNAIGDAIREKTGKEDLLTLDQMPDEIRGIGGGGSLNLNFEVIQCNTNEDLPTTAKENTIAVITEIPMAQWAFDNINPFLKDYNFIENATILSGNITSSGTIGSPTSDAEVYTEEYIPVVFGNVYNYRLSMSETKNIWLAISEYTGSYTFK